MAKVSHLSKYLMFSNVLNNLELSADEIRVYELLLAQGELAARQVIVSAGLKRGTAYNVLRSLKKKGLIEEFDKYKKSYFRLLSPVKLRDYALNKERQAKESAASLEAVLPDILSQYNLTLHKPGIRFYEGEEGIKQVAWDSLSAKTEILEYVDNEAVARYIVDFNKEYVKERKKLKIKKRMITIDTPYIHKHAQSFDPVITEVKIIDSNYPFATAMQIYNNSISYMTLREQGLIGVIVEDESIAQMHRSLFEFTWQQAKPILLGR